MQSAKNVHPILIQQQLERLENPNKPPITVYTHSAANTRMGNLKRGLSMEDQALVDRLQKLKSDKGTLKVVPPSEAEIAERLQKLRKERKELIPIPSQEEIEDRLARLKGINPDVYRRPLNLVSATKQSQPNVDAVTALLGQVAEEVAIENQAPINPISSGNLQLSKDSDDVEDLLRREIEAVNLEARKGLEDLARDEEIQQRLKQLKIDRAPNRDQTAMDCDDSDIEDNSDLGDDSDDEQGQVSRIVDQARAEARLDSMEDLDRATEQIP